MTGFLSTFARSALFPLIVIVLLVYLAGQTLYGDEKTRTITYTEVERLIRDRPETVDEVTFRPSESEVVVKLENGSKLRAHYPGTVPPAEPVTQADDRDSDGTSSPWWTFLTPLLPFALLLGFSVYLMNRIQRRRSNETLIPEAKDFRSGATNQ